MRFTFLPWSYVSSLCKPRLAAGTHPPELVAAPVALSLCMVADASFAQDAASALATSGTGHMGTSSMQYKTVKHDKNCSMHKVPATVASVGAKTGTVGVTTTGMALKMNFPPASVATLKAGDKITLHMGYSMP